MAQIPHPSPTGLNNNNRGCNPRLSSHKLPPTPDGVEPDVNAFKRLNFSKVDCYFEPGFAGEILSRK